MSTRDDLAEQRAEAERQYREALQQQRAVFDRVQALQREIARLDAEQRRNRPNRPRGE